MWLIKKQDRLGAKVFILGLAPVQKRQLHVHQFRVQGKAGHLRGCIRTAEVEDNG
jgi:hypothetical protein